MFQETPQQAIKGRYIIVGTLSRGRVSAVYRVRDSQAAGTYYALKELAEIALLTGEEKRRAREAFEEQTARWSQLEHGNLPKILDVFSSGDKHYLLMPLISGWNLAQIILQVSLPISEEMVCNWGAQLCELLSYLHQQNPPIILGELKPEHVMVTQSGLIQVVDFGLTQIFLPERESDPHLATPSPYIAPELRTGNWTPAADVYSLGMLLYAVLARRLLTPSSRFPASLHKTIPGISRRVETALTRATRRDPAARFPSAADFQEVLWGREPVTMQPLPEPETQAQLVPMASMTAVRRAWAEPTAVPKVATTEPAARPRLLTRPKRLDIEALGMKEKRQVSFIIHNAGEADLEGRLVSQVAWITIHGGAFQCAPRRSCEIQAIVWGARLPPGGASDPQAILVDSNAGRQWIGAQVQVPIKPLLALSPDFLDYGEVQDTKDIAAQLTVTNTGGGLLEGTVQSRVAWLQIPHPEFHCPSQRSAQIQVILKPKSLSPGVHDEPAALLVDSDAGQARIGVRVSRLQPMLAVAPTVLDFGALLSGEQAERTVAIANQGSGYLDYTLRSREPWLRVSSQSSRCQAGEKCPVLLIVDTAGLPEGATESTEALVVQSNAGTARVAAKVTVLAPRLALDRDRLDLGEVPLGETAQYALTIHNAGSAPLQGRLESAPEWLTLTPSEIAIAPHDSTVVNVMADTSHFSRGQVIDIPRAVHIASNGGESSLPLHMLLLRPALEIEPGKLDFGIVDRVTPARQQLIVRNGDTGLLEWRIETDAAWLEAIPHQATCSAGRELEVEVMAYGLALPDGMDAARGRLRVISNGGEREIPASIAIASPLLDVDVTQVNLGVSVNYAPLESTLLIINRGLGSLRGGVQVRSDRLAVEPSSFECATGASQVIHVRADSEGLPAGPVIEQGGLLVESNGGQAELDVRFEVVLKPEIRVTLPPFVRTQPDTPATGRLTLENSGYEAAQAKIVPSSSRLDVKRRSYVIKPGKAVSLEVTLNPAMGAEPEELGIQVVVGEDVFHIPVEVESMEARI